MTIKELVIKTKEGNLTPVEVYEDYYIGLNEERRENLMSSLMAVIVTERREGRWGSSADRNCSNCYSYLQRRWQEELPDQTACEEEGDIEKNEEAHEEEPTIPNNEEANDPNPDDVILRIFFGECLDLFLKEVKTCKNGASVARLVKWYIHEYRLDETMKMRYKPLHEALLNNGIISIKSSAWNNAIKP